ncbi:MAG: hypothetical protein IBJ19_11680 [Gemmatimonadaceae bacterium]|nr:hypothetical protein [Gemmatimonadaceae bacterium]
MTTARRFSRTFHVACPASVAYAYFRAHDRLAATLGPHVTARTMGGLTRWSITTSAGTTTWDTRITADVPGRLLAWTTTTQSLRDSWDLWFTERASDPGTDVRIVLEREVPSDVILPGPSAAEDSLGDWLDQCIVCWQQAHST